MYASIIIKNYKLIAVAGKLFRQVLLNGFSNTLDL